MWQQHLRPPIARRASGVHRAREFVAVRVVLQIEHGLVQLERGPLLGLDTTITHEIDVIFEAKFSDQKSDNCSACLGNHLPGLVGEAVLKYRVWENIQREVTGLVPIVRQNYLFWT